MFSSPLACALCTLPCCCFKILTLPSRESRDNACGGLGRKIEHYSETAISVHFHGDQPNGTKNNLGTLNKPITRKVKGFIVPETCHLHEKIDEHVHLRGLADLEFEHNLLKKLTLVNDGLIFSVSQWKQLHF